MRSASYLKREVYLISFSIQHKTWKESRRPEIGRRLSVSSRIRIIEGVVEKSGIIIERNIVRSHNFTVVDDRRGINNVSNEVDFINDNLVVIMIDHSKRRLESRALNAPFVARIREPDESTFNGSDEVESV